MKRTIFFSVIFSVVLIACGGGGGSDIGVNQTINAVDYKLPTSVPSVPDQAGK